jgi:hypothetical protein
MRRFERQALAAFGQHGLQCGQRRPGACGDYEFGRLIADDLA